MTSEQAKRLEERCMYAAWDMFGSYKMKFALMKLAEECIQIGYEQAMQHRHIEHGIGWKTGPAEEVSHEAE